MKKIWSIAFSSKEIASHQWSEALKDTQAFFVETKSKQRQIKIKKNQGHCTRLALQNKKAPRTLWRAQKRELTSESSSRRWESFKL